MVFYDLKIEKQTIYGADKIAIAANANETVALRFHFDGNWRCFDSKSVIFKTAQGRYYIIEIKNSSVKVPWEVLTLDRDIELSIVGFEKQKVLTTGTVTVHILSSLLPEDCKTFSPSETLFDRFMQDAVDSAYKKYRDEIESMKHEYDNKLLDLGSKLNEANGNAKAISEEKDEEIKTLRQDHAVEVRRLERNIADVKSELAATKIKADKWDLVDEAISQKNATNFAPWAGGKKNYKLPMMNTKSVQKLYPGFIDDYITEVGFDFRLISEISGTFREKKSLTVIELINTDNVTTLYNAFSSCPSLRDVKLGNLENCINVKWSFTGDTSLEKVTIGTNRIIQDFTGMFSGCISLREIDGVLNFSASIAVDDVFLKCTSLETVRFTEKSIPKRIDLGACKSLSRESMISLFDGLMQLNEDQKNTVFVSRYAFYNNFPTNEERELIIKTANGRGWTISFE